MLFSTNMQNTRRRETKQKATARTQSVCVLARHNYAFFFAPTILLLAVVFPLCVPATASAVTCLDYFRSKLSSQKIRQFPPVEQTNMVEEGHAVARKLNPEKPFLGARHLRSCVAFSVYDRKTKVGLVMHFKITNTSAENQASLPALVERLKHTFSTAGGNWQNADIQFVRGPENIEYNDYAEQFQALRQEIAKGRNTEAKVHSVMTSGDSRGLILNLRDGSVGLLDDRDKPLQWAPLYVGEALQ